MLKNHTTCALVLGTLMMALVGFPPGAYAYITPEDSEVISIIDEPIKYYDQRTNTVGIKAHASSTNTLYAKEDTPKSPIASVPAASKKAYDDSVTKALQKMSLRVEHLDMWMVTHAQSALNNLSKMQPKHQREVANIATYIRGHNPKIDAKTAWREAAALVHYSVKYGISSALAVAVAQAESTFNPNSVSPKGAMGVMQVMWGVHQGLLQANGINTKNDMYDPEKGIAAGCLLLSRYVRAYDTLQQAINRYYGGTATTYMAKLHKNMAKLNNHSQKSGL